MKVFAIRLLTSGLVLLCTLQALYWPLLPKPGTVLEWWQVGSLAKVGLFARAPVLLVVANSPLSGLPQTMFGWSLAFIWAGVLYFAVGAIASALTERSRRAA